MEGYLGETIVDIPTHPKYKNYTRADWAMEFVSSYGQIDGEHHKLWVLDQVARILKGTEIILKVARWDNGYTEDRIDLSETPSQEYLDWRVMMAGEIVDGQPEYGYDEGIAP